MVGDTLLPAYVLHSRRYRDSSLILDLYTRAEGRVAAVARGALGGRRGAAGPRPFQPLMVSLRGHGEMRTLGKSESAGSAVALAGTKLYCGLYLNELLLHLTAREDPAPDLYDSYERALRELAASTNVGPVLRRFEVRMLGALGHGLQLDHDCAGEAISTNRRYTYELSEGAVPAATAGAGEISGRTLQALRAGDFRSSAEAREARHLMRRILDHYLDGKPLKTRELFRRPTG